MAKIDAFFNLMFEQKASDVHLSAGNNPMLRINGELQRIDHPPLESDTLKAMLYEIAPEFKIKQFEETGDVDFGYEIPNISRFRANFFNTKNGCGAVFRQIPSKVLSFEDFEKFDAPLPPVLKKLCMLHKGLVIVTGPTGSGKSTTLAAMIDYANKYRRDHIITMEDPIEFVHESKNCLINQREVGVHTKSFATGLRGAMREDPDVVLIGEMRDLETCKIAVESALTGHLVFSTLHTNDAASTLVRLLEIGIAPYMIRSAVIGVLAQRLVRKNCPHCRVEEKIDPLLADNLGLKPGEKFLRGAGCEQCHFTGFAGRMAIYELMVMNDQIRGRVAEGVASDEFRHLAVESGMIPLPVNGVEQARTGNVSIAEIYRACM